MKMPSKLDAAHRALIAALLLGAAAVSAGQAQPAAAGQARIPAGAPLKSWQDNGQGGRYVLQILEGKSLKAPVFGVVTTDTDCDADAQGLSHCHNVVRLANGEQLTLVNSHNMHRYRCLGPGDQLALATAGASWVVGTLVTK